MSLLSRDKQQATATYERLYLIRRFEERVRELVNENRIAGVAHEYVGQEAVAVGVCSALRPDDVITSTHRGHGHVIAKGGDVRRMMAELFGRVDGFNRGRGGSMHIADVSLGIYGANGIVGAGLPIACGAAWAFKARGEDRVAVAFFGDGGSNEGAVHEAMNLAAIFNLPVVFVCENNQYAISASIRNMVKVDRISRRAAGYGFEGVTVDGMDVDAVFEAASQAVEKARSGGGPTLVECLTYRYVGHFTAEAALGLRYRSEEEIQEWKRKDPIERAAARIRQLYGWTDEERAEAHRRVEALLDEAVAFAEHSPWPDPESAVDFMYATRHKGLPAWGWA